MAVAGIGRPDAFFDELQAARLARGRDGGPSRDHHRFTRATTSRAIADEARASGAALIADHREGRGAAAAVAAAAVAGGLGAARRSSVTPDDAFASWLLVRVDRARAERPARSTDAARPSSRRPSRRRWRHRRERERPSPASCRVRPGARRRGAGRVACRSGSALAGGDVLGLAFYALDARHRRLTGANLVAAFPAQPRARSRRSARGVFRHFGRLLMEMLRFERAVAGSSSRDVSCSTASSARSTRCRPGKGALFITGHFGFWEIQALAHGLVHEPIAVVARAARQPAAARPARAGAHARPATRSSTGAAGCGASCAPCSRTTAWRC